MTIFPSGHCFPEGLVGEVDDSDTVIRDDEIKDGEGFMVGLGSGADPGEGEMVGGDVEPYGFGHEQHVEEVSESLGVW